MRTNKPQLIFLIGLPCSGKTTLGTALQCAADVDFIDLDQAIEERAGTSVSEIFATAGEAAFRRMETETLTDICGAPRCRTLIVACGGGTPCFGDNMDLMRSHGTVVWLRADRHILIRRLTEGRHKRPLVAALDADGIARYADECLAAREPFYSRATAVFDSSRLDTPDEIAATTSTFITEYDL